MVIVLRDLDILQKTCNTTHNWRDKLDLMLTATFMGHREDCQNWFPNHLIWTKIAAFLLFTMHWSAFWCHNRISWPHKPIERHQDHHIRSTSYDAVGLQTYGGHLGSHLEKMDFASTHFRELLIYCQGYRIELEFVQNGFIKHILVVVPYFPSHFKEILIN